MKEYTIYFRHGSAKPYMLQTYKTLESAKIHLYEIISLEIERQRPFYVDNEFFDNKYALGSNIFYLCILEREVSEWKKSNSEVNFTNKISFLYNL